MARTRRGVRRGEPNKMSVGGWYSTSGDQWARTWLLIKLTQFTWSHIMLRSWLAWWGMTETEVGVTISHNCDHTLNCGRLKEQTKQCLITRPVRSLPRTSAGYNCGVSNDNPLNFSPCLLFKTLPTSPDTPLLVMIRAWEEELYNNSPTHFLCLPCEFSPIALRMRMLLPVMILTAAGL